MTNSWGPKTNKKDTFITQADSDLKAEQEKEKKEEEEVEILEREVDQNIAEVSSLFPWSIVCALLGFYILHDDNDKTSKNYDLTKLGARHDEAGGQGAVDEAAQVDLHQWEDQEGWGGV